MGDATRQPRSRNVRASVWVLARELVLVAVGALVVASLIRGLVGQVFLIPSASMENTLLVSDRVVVEKLGSVQRGQVVVFADPGGWLVESSREERGPVGRALEFVGVLPDTATEHLVKRIVGTPGDHVVCCDRLGRLSVNDHPLDETDYLYIAPDGVQARPSKIGFDVVVPAGRLFVLGDNRADSRDSRCHLHDRGAVPGQNAFVSEDLVVGRALAVAWPLSDAKRLRTPDTFSDVPAGTTPPAAPSVHAGPEADC